jgi:hypothetical protein
MVRSISPILIILVVLTLQNMGRITEVLLLATLGPADYATLLRRTNDSIVVDSEEVTGILLPMPLLR